MEEEKVMRNLFLAVAAIAVLTLAANDAQAQSYGYAKGRGYYSGSYGGKYYGGKSIAYKPKNSKQAYYGGSSFGVPYSGKAALAKQYAGGFGSPYQPYYRGYGGSKFKSKGY